jgi:glutamate--cysteine ligase
MNPVFEKKILALDSPHWYPLIRQIKRGFEKESLRVNSRGEIANTLHPKDLGSSLTHSLITTDFSESLLEFITPPTEDLDKPFEILDEIHEYAYHVLHDEMLWASSMPCKLPKDEIPIAVYGSSNLGMLKNIYRRGLGHRYGRTMQTIAGVHYNFSLSETFWENYHQLNQSTLPLKGFVTEQYLGIIRNVCRFGWLLPLLFGASPAVSCCFFKGQKPALEKWGDETLMGPYATSLRLSDLGYQNKIQSTINISYNSMDEFLRTMQQAVHTPVPEYSNIGIKKDGQYCQLSDSFLQLEDEHYAMIRPKRVTGEDERMLAALMRDGIEYIEVRALDINPFIPIGIDKETIHILDAFLITCLLLESPPLTDVENQIIGYNHHQIVKWGRQPGLLITGNDEKLCIAMEEAGRLLDMMYKAANLLDHVYEKAVFTNACEMAKISLREPDSLPSARVLREMIGHRESYFDFAWRWSLTHKRYFDAKGISRLNVEKYQKLAMVSHQDQVKLENKDTLSFDEYLHRYLEL